MIDGIKLYAKDNILELNEKKQVAFGSKGNYKASVFPYNGSISNMRDSDYEVRWFGGIADTSSLGTATAPFKYGT